MRTIDDGTVKTGTAAVRPRGMAAFTVVWAGQIASLLGTACSQFALTLWAYKTTGLATPLALVGVFFTVPMLVATPLVGYLVDRLDRKLTMMASDLAAAATTLIVLVLHLTGNLEIWHLYLSAAISGLFQGFQWPAYSAAIATMLPKEHYARANGMLELAGSGSGVLAPVVAGALIGVIGLDGILVADLAGCALAVGALLCVDIPKPVVSSEGLKARGGFLKEAAFGFVFISKRPGLVGLLTYFMLFNFLSAGAFAVFAPMVLARSGNDAVVFGSVQTIGALGGVAGGLLLSAWGGFKRRVTGVFVSGLGMALLGMGTVGLARSLPFWGAGLFLWGLFGPLGMGSSQAIWQAKVPPDVQGKVFTARRLIAFLAGPLGQVMAGPLADRALGPAMMDSGRLAPVFGWLVGTGPGAGISLMFVFASVGLTAWAIVASRLRVIRDVERDLPDYDAAAPADIATATTGGPDGDEAAAARTGGPEPDGVTAA